jgi:hypothetical protein
MGAKKLNKLQLHFIQFFLDRNISDEETNKIKQIISQYYFEKAENELEKVIAEKGLTMQDIENLGNEHLRTKYTF